MKSIEGRVINLIYHSNGNLLSGLPLTDVFEHIEEQKNKTISQYQIIQETRQKILVKIVKEKLCAGKFLPDYFGNKKACRTGNGCQDRIYR